MGYFQLPKSYEKTFSHKTAISERQLGRLSIGGLLDSNDDWQGVNAWPIPLLFFKKNSPALKTPRPDERISNATLRSFYGPLAARVMFETEGVDFYVLDGKGARFQVIVPDDPNQTPFSYLNPDSHPHTFLAKLFDEPLPYRQDVFEQAAQTWQEELGLSFS